MTLLQPGPMTSTEPLSAEAMQLSDLDEILAIERVSFSAPWSRDVFVKELANRAARAVVFRLRGGLAGYICFWVVLDEAHIQTVAVNPAMRGRGYGMEIMRHLEAMSVQEGVSRIILEVGRRNIAARNLYRKCGFSAIGFRKQYYAEIDDDAVVMEKCLTSDSHVIAKSGSDLP